MTRPFRFGVMVNHSVPIPRDRRQWQAWCRHAEQVGFTSIVLSDHLWPQLAPVPAMLSAAEATSSAVRVGALMFGNDYRHPVVLAKEVASLDLLTDGRVEVGLGAGWNENDYRQGGLVLDRPGVRVDRLAESLQVLKGLWSAGRFTFHGEHYRVEGLDGTPKPVQRPHPPLAVGGGGRRVLSLAAREADIVGINRTLTTGRVGTAARRTSSGAATDEKVAWVREAAGDRFDQLELNVVVPDVVLTSDRRAAARRLGTRFGLEPDDVLEVPQLWCGTVGEICEALVERRDRWGFSYVVVVARDLDLVAPVVERLAGR